MDLTTTKASLLSVLRPAAAVVAPKSPMPVLTNLRVQARADGTITASGTDLVRALTAVGSAEVSKPGGALVPRDRILAFVQRLSEGAVTLSVQKGFLTVKQGRRSLDKLPVMPEEDYPTLPTDGAAAAALTTIPSAPILEVLRVVRGAVAQDETRPHLSAVHLTGEGDTLRAVATNGHMLALARRSVPGVGTWRALVPASFLSTFLDLAGRASEIAIGHVSPDVLGVRVDGVTATTKLVDAAFPSWEQVVPTEHSLTVTCERQAILTAVRTVAIEHKSVVRIAVCPGELVVSTEDPDNGHAEDAVPAEVTGGKLLIGVSAEYLSTVLSALPEDRVVIELSGKLDPVVLRPTGNAGTGSFAVVMPMRIS